MLDAIRGSKVGGQDIGANLDRALAEGRLVRHPDGMLGLRAPPRASRSTTLMVRNAPAMDCWFREDVMFECAYRRAVVPHACRACHKVKVVPRSLRELVALRDVARRLPATTKLCSEVDLFDRPNLWAAYVYADGLDGARALYARLRAEMDADPRLGPDVPAFIKRGCSSFERTCGPSDRWVVPDEGAAVEAALRPMVRPPASPKVEDWATFAEWITTAFRIGDETYLDFTGGRRLDPPRVVYPP
ncbi:MAG: hypothetical protein HQL38_12275 [Alphaproteobacteria bacterium]|nr:hypothetical protein [Alphaproteobacteria bacterium]